MVKIICKKRGNIYKEFIFQGHTGFAKRGHDIVCASVSILFINTFNSIERLTDDMPVTEIRKRGTRSQVIRSVLPDNLSHESEILLDSMVYGLVDIEKEYGKKYISLKFEEV